MDYYIVNLGHSAAGSELRFTRDTPNQWDVVIAKGQSLTVPFITASMRTARQLSFITITPDPDATLTIRDGDTSIAASTLTFGNASVSTTGINGEALVITTGGDTEDMDYATLTDDLGDGTTYVGYALPGTAPTTASWKIKRIVEAADGDITITWANGAATLVNAWTDRLTITYT